MDPKDKKDKDSEYGYGKKNVGKWILIYVVIAIVIYGAIYYVIKARNSSSNTSGSSGLYGR